MAAYAIFRVAITEKEYKKVICPTLTVSLTREAHHKIENGEVVKSREMYFALYQSIARDERRPGLYREFDPGFFDLIIVDECHRGSASDESNWREILEYYEPAHQLGMTATPLRQDNRDTYRYFGNPMYTYSLREGIADGFLAPYRVHRVVTSVDAAACFMEKTRHGSGLAKRLLHPVMDSGIRDSFKFFYP